MKTITQLLCLLAFIAITTKSYGQTIAHNYKEGICILAGKPVVTRTEGTTCPGCVDADKKNQEAKNKEDRRVKEIAVKKAEEERQKAIERQKKENERIAAEQKKAKENVLQLGFASSDTKVNKPEDEKATDKKFPISDEFFYLTYIHRNLGKFPLDYELVKYKNGQIDIIDYKGNRICNDPSVSEIYHVGGNWFVLMYGYDLRYYNSTVVFESAKILNIRTKEFVDIPGGRVIPQYGKNFAKSFDSQAYNRFFDYNEMKSEGSHYLNHLWLSNMLGVDIKDWIGLVRFRYEGGKELRYYVDKNDKIKLGKQTNDYDEATAIQQKFGYFPSW